MFIGVCAGCFAISLPLFLHQCALLLVSAFFCAQFAPLFAFGAITAAIRADAISSRRGPIMSFFKVCQELCASPADAGRCIRADRHFLATARAMVTAGVFGHVLTRCLFARTGNHCSPPAINFSTAERRNRVIRSPKRTHGNGFSTRCVSRQTVATCTPRSPATCRAVSSLQRRRAGSSGAMV